MAAPDVSEPVRAAPTPPAQIPPTQVGLAPPIQVVQVFPPPPSQTSQTRAGQVPPSQPTQAGSRQSLVDNKSRLPSTVELSTPHRSTVALSTPGGEREDAESAPNKLLWDQACDSLKAEGSKELKKLEKNLKELDDNDSHGDRISRLHKEDGLPGGSGRIRDCAMKMLRRVSCCIAPLTAENLPEAITTSEHETNHAPLTADAVRRIPGEFNSESPLSGYMARPHPNGTLFVRFAHASVVEYLADEKSKVGDFSPLALHSEAASLCFDFISKESAPTLPASVRDYPFGVPFDLGFFDYSCSHRPHHCEYAFIIDGTSDLLRNTSNFICSEAYLTWIIVLRDHYANQKPGWYGYWLDRVWTSGPDAKPRFVIARFGLTILLEMPEVREMFDVRDPDGRGMSLVRVRRRKPKEQMNERFAEWYPKRLPRDKSKLLTQKQRFSFFQI